MNRLLGGKVSLVNLVRVLASLLPKEHARTHIPIQGPNEREKKGVEPDAKMLKSPI